MICCMLQTIHMCRMVHGVSALQSVLWHHEPGVLERGSAHMMLELGCGYITGIH